MGAELTRSVGGDAGAIVDAGAAPAFEYGGVGDLGYGVQAFVPNVTTRQLTPEDIAEAQQLKLATMGPPGPAAQPAQTATEETLQWAATQPAEVVLSLTLILTEVPFDWGQLRQAHGAAREQVIIERKSDLAASQGAIVAKLNALGITQTHGMWLANEVQAQVPNQLVSEIAGWPEVVELDHPPEVVSGGYRLDGYYGGDRRASIRADTLIAAGYTGTLGGWGEATPVLVADVGERNCSYDGGVTNAVPRDHPGFKMSRGQYRIWRDVLCMPHDQETCG